MHPITAITAFTAMFTIATAAPAMADTTSTESVTTFSGKDCSGTKEDITLTAGTTYCIPVTDKSSISINSDCALNSWSGEDCNGSGYVLGQGCYNVFFASLSVQC